MASQITSIPIDCTNSAALAAFWADVLGWQVTASGWQNTPHGKDGITIAPEGGGSIEIDFRWVPDGAKDGKNRLHLDINPTDRDQDRELERLLALGAKHVDVGQGAVRWYVLADPEGNEFCLCRDRVEPRGLAPATAR